MPGAVEDNGNPRLDNMRQCVDTLRQLLQMLYPEPVPEIFTLDDFQLRYRLRGFGAPAMREIEQSQRINRAIGSHRQIGLCEFHIGLVYFSRNDCQGAKQQFTEAERQWSFAHDVASMCLAHFAGGCAQYFAYQYEAAMTQYGKAEQLLPRIQFTPPSSQDEFIGALREALTAAQATLRHEMWPPPDQPEEAAPEAAAPGVEAPETEVAVAEEVEPVTEAAATQPELTIPDEPEPAIAAPISNLDTGPVQPGSPVPAHEKVNDYYIWYQVIERRDDFLPDVRNGSWLLVDSQTAEHEYKPGELVIVTSDVVDGSIPVKPRAHNQPFHRVYLARWEIVGSFTRDVATGKVTFSEDMKQIPVNQDKVMGVVVGFWWRIPDLVMPD